MLIKFSKLKNYNISPRGVIHVGMHKAEEYPIYKRNGVDDILFIEANKDLVDEMLDRNVDNRCKIIHAAVSDKKEEVTFNITNNGESSSILELGEHSKIYPSIVNVQTVKMYTTDLDTIIVENNIDLSLYNVINLDIQGAELKAMKGLSDWSNIEAVYTEVNFIEMYKGCDLVDAITDFLKPLGFIKVEQEDTGQGWGDAIYIKIK